jgi:hypothetical protein
MTAIAQPTRRERLFRPSYAAHLVDDWIPALEGVEAKLHAGARVVVVGGGPASSLAQAFASSRIDEFNDHTFPGAFYDLVASFDALHGVPDPLGAAQHVHRSLADDGTWLVVDPGRARLTEMIRAAGFSRVRRVAETPLSLVFEARP